jgi:ferredoxin
MKRFTQRMLVNRGEEALRANAAEAGCEVCKRGWPDFFCFDSSGRPFVVEVKPRSPNGRLQRLKREQSIVMAELKKLGLRCYVSDGKVLEPYDPGKHDGPYVAQERD